MEKQIMTVDATAGQSKEELDAQLVRTLREIDPHNYPYLFERCKSCNVNARQLRFFEKDQIHELIPKTQLGILAEFEYLLSQWQISKGYDSLDAKIQLNRANDSNSPQHKPQTQSNFIIAKEKPHIPSNNQPVVVVKQEIDIKPQISSPAIVADEPDELLTKLDSDENSNISNAKRIKLDKDDEEKFTLETIVPELLKELKNSYESKNSLSTIERRLLCSSIVDYFLSRKIKFSSNTMEELSEQIVAHFPTENKKSWCNHDDFRTRGRFYFRFHNARRNIPKETNDTYNSKNLTNSSEDENTKIERFTLEAFIPELLKQLQDSYESKNSLSTNERRLLCSSIVDYFKRKDIKFSTFTMAELAQQIVEHFPTEDKKSWYNRNGRITSGRFYYRIQYLRTLVPKKTNNSNSSDDEDNEQKFTLEEIIPELLKNLKDSYELKNSLSTNERSFLCKSIVHYFENRKIKFSADTMDDLAEQIVAHFPTEDKKSWCNRDGQSACGSFVYRLYNLRKNMAKQTNNTSTSKVVTNSASSEDEDNEEQFTLETIIPELLKELKDIYKTKDFLSRTERSLLCSSIVDYFVSRNIHFRFETMNELAEQIVEHFPTEDKKSWCNRDGDRTIGRFYFRIQYVRNHLPKRTKDTSISNIVANSSEDENSRVSNAKRMKFDKDDDEEKFTLETIVPDLLNELKDSYESNNSLSTNERRLLCSSIVDYFKSRDIKFSSHTMDKLAEQIVEHFPTEDKKSWYNHDGRRKRGRLFIRRSYSLRNKQTKNTSSSKAATNSNSSEDEDDEEKFTLEEIIPELLKELKDSYKTKDCLSRKERHFLCSSIVEYFQSRKINFRFDTMDELAEQISQHFPTEQKKSWCNRDGRSPCGTFVYRVYNLRRNIPKQTNNTFASKVVTNYNSSDNENSKRSNPNLIKFEEDDDGKKFTLEAIIPELLKELKDSYESNNSLSTNERRILCSSIVDYFKSKNIKFSSHIMNKLAKQIVVHFPTEDKISWYNRNGPSTTGRFYNRKQYLRSLLPKKANNTSISKIVTDSNSSEDENSKISNAKLIKLEEDDDEGKFKLEAIIPELLKELKDSYESNNTLSTNERHFLCSSIVDYFESRKIKFSPSTMDALAEQIVEHFPTEDKKSWCNRDGFRTGGRFYFRFHNSRRNIPKQTNDTSNSKVLTNSNSSEDENSKISNAKHMKFDEDDDEEQFTLEEIIPELLKELKDSYELKNSLSTIERRLLCSSIVDYFVSRKIKFSSDTMEEFSEQIVEHFPTEDKKYWCNREGHRTLSPFFSRFHYVRRNIPKQTSNTSTANVTLEIIIPELLRELKGSYESKNALSTIERRLLCSSIVDYFENRDIKFSTYTMNELAEQIVEQFPTEDKKSWYNRDGDRTCGWFFFCLQYSRRNMASQDNNASTSKFVTNSTLNEDDGGEVKFTLETIVPELLKELKDGYKSKKTLSTNDRRILCNSIVDYFQSRKIKFRSGTMDELAEQIVEHFPSEDKKSWFNGNGSFPRGQLFYRLRYVMSSRYKTPKQTNDTFNLKAIINSNSSEPESREEIHDEGSKSIQAWLKSYKCEDFSEITDLWKDTMKYRCFQMQNLKDLKGILEFLNNWPSYKLETGHELWTMDFEYLYPQAMQTFRTRWLVYKQNIEQFLKVELKDVNCIKLLEKYQLQKATINEDSSSCILIYLVHAITKPLRHFEAVGGNVSYAITDSQHSMMCLIQHKAEIDAYAEPYPCIFLVGDSLLDVQECYVVFMDLCYKLSYENCLAVCVQIFTILKMEDPSASQCFWEFIRGYMFNITKDKEKFNLAIENMVNYLESVASSV